MPFYHNYLPSGMPSQTLRTSIVLRSHADADGRYLTAHSLCSTITSISHYILRRGFMPDEDFQPSEVHPISEVSTGKWVLLLVAIAYVAGSDRKSTRLNSSHSQISYAVFCLKKKI